MPGSGVLVLGSTGPTGEMLVRALRTEGRTVWVVHRSDARREEFEELGATVLIGDAMDRESMLDATGRAAAGCDTIVNLIGGSPMNPPESWPDYEGNVNSIDAAVSAGIRRYVFVTSVGTGSSQQYVPENDFVRPILELKSRAEAHLKESGLSYCIVKPGGLWHGEKVSEGDEALVTENDSVRGVIDRTQLVTVIRKVLDDEQGVTDGKELYAVTYKIDVIDGDAQPFDFQQGK